MGRRPTLRDVLVGNDAQTPTLADTSKPGVTLRDAIVKVKHGASLKKQMDRDSGSSRPGGRPGGHMARRPTLRDVLGVAEGSEDAETSPSTKSVTNQLSETVSEEEPSMPRLSNIKALSLNKENDEVGDAPAAPAAAGPPEGEGKTKPRKKSVSELRHSSILPLEMPTAATEKAHKKWEGAMNKTTNVARMSKKDQKDRRSRNDPDVQLKLDQPAKHRRRSSAQVLTPVSRFQPGSFFRGPAKDTARKSDVAPAPKEITKHDRQGGIRMRVGMSLERDEMTELTKMLAIQSSDMNMVKRDEFP
jgi:hypothetical protein